MGGLPVPLIADMRARAIVDLVEKELWTPLGLRSLAPEEAGYVHRYAGNGDTRDAAYHQGTVWPWLIGPFVDAWLRVRGYSEDARIEARKRFIAPLDAPATRRGWDMCRKSPMPNRRSRRVVARSRRGRLVS